MLSPSYHCLKTYFKLTLNHRMCSLAYTHGLNVYDLQSQVVVKHIDLFIDETHFKKAFLTSI